MSVNYRFCFSKEFSEIMECLDKECWVVINWKSEDIMGEYPNHLPEQMKYQMCGILCNLLYKTNFVSAYILDDLSQLKSHQSDDLLIMR